MMKTTQIHDGKYYIAFLIAGDHGGIVVNLKRGKGGVMLRNDHRQYDEYLTAFQDHLCDVIEGDALCRALFRM